MKRVIVLLLCVTCLSCSPSKNAIETAIAQTQAAAPTSTALPTPTTTPAPTATIAPTATPDLFTGTAKSLAPGERDMPFGFALNTRNSGPIQTDDGDGYTSSFMNADNMFSQYGDAILVTYQVFVPSTTQGAKDVFARIANDAADHMTDTIPGEVLKPFKPVTAVVPHVEESSTICGTVQGPMLPMTTCAVSIRVRNVVVWTMVAGDDIQGNNDASLDQALYFTSLVVELLAP